MAEGYWECLYCESSSVPRKKNGVYVCRKCEAPWDDAIWVGEDEEYTEEN